eukprot:6184273-Pleurochrysis_carterae.AAC.1
MVLIIRGNRHHAKHSCQSDASDWAAGNILHIPPSALTALVTMIFSGSHIPFEPYDPHLAL